MWDQLIYRLRVFNHFTVDGASFGLSATSLRQQMHSRPTRKGGQHHKPCQRTKRRLGNCHPLRRLSHQRQRAQRAHQQHRPNQLQIRRPPSHPVENKTHRRALT
jgi:hypothetical protein